MLLCIVEKCYWDVAVDNSIKAAWEHKAKERYRQYIYDMSNKNPTHEKPSHIEQQVWNAWNAIWNSEDFKKKSEQNKKNRRKGVVGGKAPPTHNGGSASHKQIALDMVSVFLLVHIIMITSYFQLIQWRCVLSVMASHLFFLC